MIRFDALDAWRGVCALLVALYHLNLAWSLHHLDVVRNGFLFVDFFFVLSGFVITHAYRDRLDGAAAFVRFMIRRIGRVWPLHATVLAAFVVIELAKAGILHDPAGGERVSRFAVITNLALIHALGIHDGLTWNTPSWSISAEVWVYAAFGLLVVLTARHRLLAIVAAGGGGLVVVAAFSPHAMDATYDFGFFRCLYGFATGCLVHRLWMHRPPGAWLSRAIATAMEVAAVAVTVLFVANAGAGPASLAAPPVFAVVVWVFAHQQGAISLWLCSAPLQNLGRLSYGLYIVHGLVVYTLANAAGLTERLLAIPLISAPAVGGGPGLLSLDRLLESQPVLSQLAMDLIAVIYVAAVVGLAEVANRLIEQPGRRFFNRLAERRTAGAFPENTFPEEDRTCILPSSIAHDPKPLRNNA